MGAKPGAGIGGLAARGLARGVADRGLVLDLRSGSSTAAWQPQRATQLVVRGFTEAPDGKRTVISHMVKRTRGEVGASSRVTDDGPVRWTEVLAQINGRAFAYCFVCKTW